MTTDLLHTQVAVVRNKYGIIVPKLSSIHEESFSITVLFSIDFWQVQLACKKQAVNTLTKTINWKL